MMPKISKHTIPTSGWIPNIGERFCWPFATVVSFSILTAVRCMNPIPMRISNSWKHLMPTPPKFFNRFLKRCVYSSRLTMHLVTSANVSDLR